MADLQSNSLAEKDVEQAITTLKKGAYLLKYGRRGKPAFCPFRISNDGTVLIWYAGSEEKQLQLSRVSRIIPGQCTAIFRRYPRPEKEYQSFSLIYKDRSLDLICKDKGEAEVWFVALRALISRCNYHNWEKDARSETGSLDHQCTDLRRISSSIVSSNISDITSKEPGDDQTNSVPSHCSRKRRLGRAFSDIISYTAATPFTRVESAASSLNLLSAGGIDDPNGCNSAVDTFRISLSSSVSSPSRGSPRVDFDALGDVFIWGEAISDALLSGDVCNVETSSFAIRNALLPMALESTVVLDAYNIACGSKHALLVTKQGAAYSWGDGLGGRLGHGVEADVSQPKLIDALSGLNIELVACGEYHTCAVTLSGELYTWGDGTRNFDLLGHGNGVSHWIPRKLSCQMEGMHVSSISCGPWHTAAVTSAGQLFTFGDGTFGALGHGDRKSTSTPREVEILKGLRTMRASCGVWHTAAVVEITHEPSISSTAGKLFTWGDGDKDQLGHGDEEPRLVPSCVAILSDITFCQVACGHSVTVALTDLGQVYTMGSAEYGQLGRPQNSGRLPTCIEGIMRNSFIKEIACGSHHVAVLSSKAEVYTWGKGANGQLGHGDNNDRDIPTVVEALKDKQVKSVACGSNFTAAICLHKWFCSADRSRCSGCRNPFNFRRKRHNCYNCGLVFCKTCSSKKSLKASLAPNMNKPYRVCDNCYIKLQKALEFGFSPLPKVASGNKIQSLSEVAEKETLDSKSHGRFSRLTSFNSFKQAENQCSKCDLKLESNNGHVSPIQNGTFQWEGFCTSSTLSSILGSSRKVSASVPGSRIISRATSPSSRIVSRATSPVSRNSSSSFSMTLALDRITHSSLEVSFDHSKQTNDNLIQEIIMLRAQVEDLTRKSQFLEEELERTSRQLKEVTATTGEVAGKNRAENEVIGSLIQV